MLMILLSFLLSVIAVSWSIWQMSRESIANEWARSAATRAQYGNDALRFRRFFVSRLQIVIGLSVTWGVIVLYALIEYLKQKPF
jgi:hypothetical protein